MMAINNPKGASMEFQKLIEDRYSVRKFTDEPVTREEIEAILEAGRIAPTARNSQPQRIWVCTKPEDLAKIDECSPCRFNAPAVLIVGFSKADTFMHPDTRDGDWCYGYVDGSIVFTHMMLKAHDLGLGSCWVGLFDSQKIQEVFDIPEDMTVFSLLPFGHEDPNNVANPRHFERKPLDETVTWL